MPRVAGAPARAEALAIDERGPFRLRAVMRGDATAIAPFLRESDLLDIAATAVKPPLEAILASLATSDRTFAADFDGQCVAVAGTAFRNEINRTFIWLLGSERFDVMLRSGGWRLFKPWFEIIAGDAAVLFTVMAEANKRDIRWLTWLGFEQEGRFENFRGRGHTCVRMVLRRGTPVAASVQPAAVSAEADAPPPKAAPPERAATDLANITRDAAFEAILPQNLGALFAPERFSNRTPLFDDITGTGDGLGYLSWENLRRRFDRPFDIAREPVVDERLLIAMQTDYVASRLADPERRAAFVNRTMHNFFSTMLYAEQASVGIAASLCLVLGDPAAQAFAAMQAQDEAKHVSLLSFYIKTRWGAPVTCAAESKALYAELMTAHEAYKKIIGLQILNETVALSAYAILHDGARDPLIADIMRILIADEISHHEFGDLWRKKTLARVSQAEANAIEACCAQCFRTLLSTSMSPDQLRQIYLSLDLEPDRVQMETGLLLARRVRERGDLGLAAVFRDTAIALRRQGLIRENTLGLYESLFDLSADGGESLDRAREIARSIRAAPSGIAAQ